MMRFVNERIIEKEGCANSVIIDGYSTNKTLKGAIRDLSKVVYKYNKQEAEVMQQWDSKECLGMLCENMYNGEYFLEAEKVDCAAKIGDQGEVLHKDAEWYMCVLIVE